ncbi:MAG TPA: sigma-70 family RNA polymerase sigma factor [Solirubrobacteraceae bacterium]|jgi:RNA polymerase primary sigma factor|nr:sigma-70 family RNA polymerase sigma factor [Solirubrobacteraceae bacterium]
MAKTLDITRALPIDSLGEAERPARAQEETSRLTLTAVAEPEDEREALVEEESEDEETPALGVTDAGEDDDDDEPAVVHTLRRATSEFFVDESFIPESVDQLLAHSRRYPLLTPAQEIELAQRIERGDLRAKEMMINSNLRLVASNARRYQNQGLPLADLVQEGMLGLIRASEKFDWRKGFRFSTYATLWIRQAIQRGLENSGRTIRLPVHVAQRSRKVGRVERELSVRLGREPTIDEIAEETGLPIDQIEEVRHQRAALVSLDQQVGEDGDTALGDLLPSDQQAPEETAWDNERERLVHEAIASLPETERTVLTLRFGTGREEPQTLTAIGKRLGFSAERASQLEQRALKKLAESPELAALREAA